MLVLLRGLLAFAFIALWVYCVFDVIKTDESRVQNLPKFAWLAIVILVPTIGSAAWLLLGRPPTEAFETGRPQRRQPPPKPDEPPIKPSMPDFEARREEALRRYMADREDELKKREEEIRRLEEEFRKKHDDETPNN